MNTETKKPFFRVFLLLFIVINILAVSLGLLVIWRGLEDYEYSIPAKTIETAVNNIKKGDYSLLVNAYEPTTFENADIFKGYLDKKLKNTEITHQKINADSTDEMKYFIKSDKEKIAEVLLVKTGVKSMFGFDKWELHQVKNIYGAVKHISLTADEHTNIYINGVAVSKENAKFKETEYQPYEGLPDGFKPPMQIVYTAENLIDTPQITAQGKNGEECIITFDDNNANRANIKAVPSEEIKAKTKTLTENTAIAYAKFIAKDGVFAELNQYLLQKSKFQKDMSLFDNRWYIAHDSHAFQNIKSDNFIIYKDDYVSCDISFEYVVKMGRKTFTYNSAYTVYMVKSGEKWLVANMAVK